MFCLRSYLVLLFLPINASPIFVLSFFILTYLLNRPCVYCSLLLLILFASSCYWSDQCFFDLHGNWFEPRHLSSPLPNPLPHAGCSSPSFPSSLLSNNTISNAAALAANATVEAISSSSTHHKWKWDDGLGAGVGEAGMVLGAVNETARALAKAAVEEGLKMVRGEVEGTGFAWARSWLGARVWRVPCLDVDVRL